VSHIAELEQTCFGTVVSGELSGVSDLNATLVVGGIRSSRMDRAELTQAMLRDTREARSGALVQPRIVVSSNGMVVAEYHRDPKFRDLIQRADIVDVDGMPLVFATKLLCKVPLRERVATTDFVKDACAAAAREGTRFYFLGAMPGYAAESAANLTRAFPGLQMAGTRHGYFSADEEAQICADIVAAGTDILWLGLGSPLQEQFAFRNRHRLAGLAWIRTCGGLFDFYSERVPRAPRWVQDIGLEWLFRVSQEPRRLGMRYILTNPAALYYLLTQTHD
jgi:exopolysaccharide biosynthesis WecB/TagA/CpsF family protein